MNDHDFLVWLRGRLINVYHESEYVDFVHRLDEVIVKLKYCQCGEDYTDGTPICQQCGKERK